MTSGGKSNAALIERAGNVLTGGALGRFKLPDEVDLVLASGAGSHVTDVSGNEYIDYLLGSGPLLLGHAHPAVEQAVRAQLPLGTSYFFLNEPAIELAEVLVEHVPCGQQVRYTSTGTEATYFALRCARVHAGRSKIMKFEGAWHGMHDYALWGTVPSEASDYPDSLPDSAGIPEAVGDGDSRRAVQRRRDRRGVDR